MKTCLIHLPQNYILNEPDHNLSRLPIPGAPSIVNIINNNLFSCCHPWTWSYIAKIIYYLVSDMRFLLTRRYDEEYVRGNIFK
ncbi:Uncharacterised protein [Salmonella enterica subsp. enterica]|uniref:Uncharacterized protein n=1 Tax=Salmonella enterica I TaxID=59201 RepID=A0A379WW65_SALET|nr:Uncharacterised protein [Salmonella enterica subsp. enterica]